MKIWVWLKAHVDHFLISIGVSIAVSFASSPVLHHMHQILTFLHIPARIISWLGY